MSKRGSPTGPGGIGDRAPTATSLPPKLVFMSPPPRPIFFVAHPSAEISPSALVGDGVVIWQNSQVREEAVIGARTHIGANVYVDATVHIGTDCKIQNNVSIYEGVSIYDGVFIGPHVTFTNDKVPRAITPRGRLKTMADWDLSPTVVGYGASIGAGAVILPGIVVGQWAMVGAGAVVTKRVADYSLVVGNPARHIGFVHKDGTRR